MYTNIFSFGEQILTEYRTRDVVLCNSVVLNCSCKCLCFSNSYRCIGQKPRLCFALKVFHTYFPDVSALDLNFIHSVQVEAEVQEDLLRFVNDSTARDAFEALPLPTFCSKMS